MEYRIICTIPNYSFSDLVNGDVVAVPNCVKDLFRFKAYDTCTDKLDDLLYSFLYQAEDRYESIPKAYIVEGSAAVRQRLYSEVRELIQKNLPNEYVVVKSEDAVLSQFSITDIADYWLEERWVGDSYSEGPDYVIPCVSSLSCFVNIGKWNVGTVDIDGEMTPAIWFGIDGEKPISQWTMTAKNCCVEALKIDYDFGGSVNWRALFPEKDLDIIPFVLYEFGQDVFNAENIVDSCPVKLVEGVADPSELNAFFATVISNNTNSANLG